jgi:porphobilinogen synthase
LSTTYGSFPGARPRRLRTTPAMRRMVAETRLHPAELILPAFVREGVSEPVPLQSMPGVLQHTRDSLRKAAAEAVAAGIGGIMLFGVPEDSKKDAVGTPGTDPDGILQQAIRDVRAEVGDDLVIMSDLCLDEHTDHGHCGVLDAEGRIDNDTTLERYAEMARVQADAGVHTVGPSGMMDGQVGVIREALDGAGYQDVSILAYTVKYASAFYGPFREAVGSSLQGDRKTYQQDPPNARESLREAGTGPGRGRRHGHGQARAAVPGHPAPDRGRGGRAGGRVPDLRRVRDGRGGRRERLDRPGPRDHGDPSRGRRDDPHLLGHPPSG